MTISIGRDIRNHVNNLALWGNFLKDSLEKLQKKVYPPINLVKGKNYEDSKKLLNEMETYAQSTIEEAQRTLKEIKILKAELEATYSELKRQGRK